MTRLLNRMLFRALASGTLIFDGVALVLGAVALLAIVIPALRAARVDPLEALRRA